MSNKKLGIIGVVLVVVFLITLFLNTGGARYGTIQGYFNAYLSAGDEIRESVRIETVPSDFSRVKFEGKFVGMDFEAFSHKVYVHAAADWFTRGQQDFYLELERPSACYAQVLFGVVDESECTDRFISEYFGPFTDDLVQVITNEAFFTVSGEV